MYMNIKLNFFSETNLVTHLIVCIARTLQSCKDWTNQSQRALTMVLQCRVPSP